MASTRVYGVLFCIVILNVTLAKATGPGSIRHYVNGREGWVPNPSQAYNQWAGSNRFLVNDTLYFSYNKEQDSVLEVKEQDYNTCNTNNPIMKQQNGETEVSLGHSGPYYFISGNKSRCDQGEKLIVRVLSTSHPPPSPTPLSSPPSPLPTQPPTAAAPVVSPPSVPSPATSPSSPSAMPPSSATPVIPGPASSPSSATPVTPGPASSPSSATPVIPGPALSPGSVTPVIPGPATSPSSSATSPTSGAPMGLVPSMSPIASGPTTASGPSIAASPSSLSPASSPASDMTPASSPSSGMTPAGSPASDNTPAGSPGSSLNPATSPGADDVTAPAAAPGGSNSGERMTQLTVLPVAIGVLSVSLALISWF